MMSDSEPIESRFRELLARVFREGEVSFEERIALWTAIVAGGLPAERTDRILVSFLEEQFAHFAADGHLSPDELTRLRLMVDVLGISSAHLPEEIRRVL